ncbi:expressed unknown protein [Seminavis robusta]|uniref:Uncharacterized protein n=1 Tax=Seminavis robusta TaxID=568900 RepID=A0A9N8H795_9STRA|nr:expressed unknown protein [Seminavis robusta]|eukprot:Sro122_g059340.1 n/a (111) ;mRNA; f:109246-109682
MEEAKETAPVRRDARAGVSPYSSNNPKKEEQEQALPPPSPPQRTTTDEQLKERLRPTRSRVNGSNADTVHNSIRDQPSIAEPMGLASSTHQSTTGMGAPTLSDVALPEWG